MILGNDLWSSVRGLISAGTPAYDRSEGVPQKLHPEASAVKTAPANGSLSVINPPARVTVSVAARRINVKARYDGNP